MIDLQLVTSGGETISASFGGSNIPAPLQPNDGAEFSTYVEGNVPDVVDFNITLVTCFAGTQSVQVPDATTAGYSIYNFYVMEDIDNPGYGWAQFTIANLSHPTIYAPLAIDLMIGQDMSVTLELTPDYFDGTPLGTIEVPMGVCSLETINFFSGASLEITDIYASESWTQEIDFQDTQTSGDITVSDVRIGRGSYGATDCDVYFTATNNGAEDANITVEIVIDCDGTEHTAEAGGPVTAGSSETFGVSLTNVAQEIFDTYDADPESVTITSITIS